MLALQASGPHSEWSLRRAGPPPLTASAALLEVSSIIECTPVVYTHPVAPLNLTLSETGVSLVIYSSRLRSESLVCSLCPRHHRRLQVLCHIRPLFMPQGLQLWSSEKLRLAQVIPSRSSLFSQLVQCPSLSGLTPNLVKGKEGRKKRCGWRGGGGEWVAGL